MMRQLTQNDAKMCLLVPAAEYFSFLLQPTPKMFKIMQHHVMPGEYKWNNARTVSPLHIWIRKMWKKI